MKNEIKVCEICKKTIDDCELYFSIEKSDAAICEDCKNDLRPGWDLIGNRINES